MTNQEKRRTPLAPFAAAGTALATLACCLPTCFGAAAATAGVGLVLTTAQPWFLAFSIALIATGVVQLIGAKRTCLVPSRTSLILLGLAALIVTLILADSL